MNGSWLTLELTHPWRLVCLAAVPVLVYYFYRSLVDFPRWQRGVSLAIRSVIVVLLVIYGCISWFSDTSWGVAGGSMRRWSARSPHRIERMIGGGGLCIIAVGTWLALSHGAG